VATRAAERAPLAGPGRIALVSELPIDRLIAALDRLDVDGAMALMAPDGRILTADGRRAKGSDAVRHLVADFLAALSSTTHKVTDKWHLDNVEIAEAEATYELRDGVRIGPLPRVFILREGEEGISDVRVYGAHERPLSEQGGREQGTWIGGRWLPPL
jgi:SnoaL-like domain